MLLERESSLEQLGKAYELAGADSGRIALISGEAGIGKTSLIETFVGSLPEGSPVYWGGCEALFVARPLGPLFDIAEQLGGKFLKVLHSDADVHKIHSSFLALIESADFASAVFVIEDIHWADNATMDFFKFVGRRIKRCNCLLLASYRDDEIGANHPLHHVIGDLPGNATTRVIPAALSPKAIARIGRIDLADARKIHRTTNGNPFFVQELITSGGRGVPRTVSDTILAKASRLGEEPRMLLNLVAVVPGKCEMALLETAFPEPLSLVDACAEQGLLTADHGFVRFRHELARLAIEDALPAGQRSRWNAHVLAELESRQPNALARLAHHADISGNSEAVLRYAPHAARQSAKLGAHREAVVFYRLALGCADTLPARERADLLENLAYELYVTGKIEDAISVRSQCLEICRGIGDRQGEARSLRWLSRLNWFSGKRAEADRFAEQALNVSAPLRETGEYAMACSNRAQLFMLSSEAEPTVEWASRAIELARLSSDKETLAHALNNLGTALRQRSPDEGTKHLLSSLRLSLENNFHEHVARAYTNLSSTMISARQYDEASGYLEAGLGYTSDRDLDSWYYYMLGWRARLKFETGEWDSAGDDVTAVFKHYRGAALIGSPAMTTLARLRLRRGDPDYETSLEHALEAITHTRELERFGPLIAARAENAWLLNTNMADIDVLRETRDWARRLEHPWLLGELCWWLRKLGYDDVPVGELAHPYERLLCGEDWAGAAEAWTTLGCPYESALALEEGDPAARRRALQIFLDLGAAPAAAKLSRELRAAGVRNVPTGARQSTRDNPAGLTNRQIQVLGALSEGLSDAEIAARLFISPRTVGHHVSAILGKLDADSRTEAAAKAIKMGIGIQN